MGDELAARMRVLRWLIALMGILHALELGAHRPMPTWLAYYGVFGDTPNVLIAALCVAGAIGVLVGRQWRRFNLSRLGKELIGAGLILNALGRAMWLGLNQLGGSVPQPPPAIGISPLTLAMYAALYAVAGGALFALARRDCVE